MLTNNSIGFVVARGLDAYGFSHLTFQEYFVALKIVQPYVDNSDLVLNSLLAQIIQPKFREPLVLAMEWINCNWKSDQFNTFCLELLQAVSGPFPIGALFLSSVLGNLSNPPELHILIRLFNVLVSSSTDRYCFQNLAIGLKEMKSVSILIEHLFQKNTNIKDLCRFFTLSLEYDRDGVCQMPEWLPKIYFLRLEASDDTNEELVTTIDSIFHCLSNSIWSNKLQLSNPLVDVLEASKENIHPTMLSLLIILCGGLYENHQHEFSLEDYTPKPIQFDASRMHRSTPLADVLIAYFTEDRILNLNEQFDHLIEKCHKIILIASFDDVSRRVVDAFIALICLRGLSDLLFYKPLLHYHALSRALYRMRLALYQMRQFYHVKQSTLLNRESLPSCASQGKLQGCQILEKFITNPNVNISMVSSFSIAMCAAFSHLFSHASSVNVSWDEPLPISMSKYEILIQNSPSFSAKMLHTILNPCSKDAVDDVTKWNDGLHSFQIYYNHPLFPVAFISTKLQPIFERLISTKHLTNKNTIPFVVVLAEVLLSVDEIFRRSCGEKPLKIVLILRLFENDIHTHQLISYLQATIHDIKMKVNCNDWHFSDYDRNVEPIQNENALKLALNLEHERINVESDIQLFTASIGLVRIMKSLNNIHDSIFEEIHIAMLSIRDPVLRILCLRHVKEIVRSCIDTKYYHIVQNDIIDILENIYVDEKLLIVLALVLGTCVEDHLHPSMERLLNVIWKRLQHEAIDDEDMLDQQAVFQMIRHIIGYHQISIPLPFLVHSALLQLNSSIFHTIFQNMTFNYSETTLLAQLYLAEITIDAQILSQISHETDALPVIFDPLYVKKILRYSWQPYFEKFSHRQVILINSLVLSPSVELEDIPFSKLRDCTGFEEEKDRPIVESWLNYHDDERCAQVAILAVLLLIRAQKDMTPIIHSKVELIFTKGLSSKMDSIRQGVRACFASSNQISRSMCYWGWSTPMWHLLRNLMICSLGVHFTTFLKDTVQRMESILEAERHRLNVHHIDDPFSQFSLLCLINPSWNDDESDIQIYLSEILTAEKRVPDIYIAYVIFHVVRQRKEKEWCDKLYELLHNLLYDTNLPSAQLASIYALASQKRGREVLIAALTTHFDSELLDEPKYMSEPELIACFIALTDNHDGITNMKSLSSSLWQIWYSIKTESVCAERHFQACLLSHLKEQNDHLLSIVQSSFNVTYQELYTLYTINTAYFVLEWDERAYWVHEAEKFIVSHRHEILPQFISDLYMCLTTETKTNAFQNPVPNYLAVARELTERNNDLFCQAIRISVFGEEEFKTALYVFNKRTATVDQKGMCLELYASFQTLTEQFIEMVFDLCLEDFSTHSYDVVWWCKKVTSAKNRKDIEIIISYLKSSSIYQRQVALKWLLNLVRLDILSIYEMHQLASETDVWEIANENDKFRNISEWYDLMNLRPLHNEKYFHTLTMDEVEADYSELVQTSSLQFI